MSEQAQSTTEPATGRQIANVGIEHPLLPGVTIRIEVYDTGDFEVSERVTDSGDIWAICAVNGNTLHGYKVTDYLAAAKA